MAISAPDLATHLSTGAGRILFAEGVYSHDGGAISDTVFSALDGYVDLGEPYNVTNTQEPGTETTYNSNRTQARPTIFSNFSGQTRSIAVTSLSIIDDNFALWESKITRWNSVGMGPKRDITGELAKAIRARGMKFVPTRLRSSARASPASWTNCWHWLNGQSSTKPRNSVIVKPSFSAMQRSVRQC